VLVKIAPKECLVGSNLDLRTMIAKISNLQAGGLIRADVSPAHVRAHAWTTASSVALKLQPLIIVRVFDKMPDLDNCGFVQTITGFDGKPQAAYAFKMTRDLYRKVDWSSYVPTNLPKDSKNFTIGAAIASHMNAEAKAKQ